MECFLGGAIGGVAISGTLGNIASNVGAIKFVLPNIVSGGLNSAFAGGNFLGVLLPDYPIRLIYLRIK
jgi:hypothetical protein